MIKFCPRSCWMTPRRNPLLTWPGRTYRDNGDMSPINYGRRSNPISMRGANYAHLIWKWSAGPANLRFLHLINDGKIGQFVLRNLILLNIPHGPLMMCSQIWFSGCMYIIDGQHGTYFWECLQFSFFFCNWMKDRVVNRLHSFNIFTLNKLKFI